MIRRKTEIIFCAGSGGLPLLLKTPHCGVFLTQLRPPSITTIKELLWCRKRGSAHAAKKAPLGLFLNAASPPVHHNKKGTPNGVPLVPEAGVEPARCRHHGILSPARLPIPSFRRKWYCITGRGDWQGFSLGTGGFLPGEDGRSPVDRKDGE